MLRALAFVVVLGTPVVAEAEPPPPPERPAFKFLRYQEDWSQFDPAALSDASFLDDIKHVTLNEDGSVWASFGGHFRARMESWSGWAFGAPADDSDTFGLYRVLLHADVHFGDSLRVFVEGKSALSNRDLPGGRRGLDVDALDLEQLFADIRIDLDNASIVVRPGRQTFLFGKQRLVSPLPWANTMRRWDGVSAIVDAGGWDIHGFWSQFVPVKKYEFNDPDDDTEFYGVYATTPVGDNKLDLYFLGLDRDKQITFNGTTGEESRYTFGGRIFGNFTEDLDFDFEGAYQTGDVGEGDVDAFMIGTEFGWSIPDNEWSPRLFAGFDYGSGDDDPGGDVGTFNQLFPLGHKYLGFTDTIGRQNIMAVNLGATVKPIKGATVILRGHAYWRAEDEDALYNAGGAVIRPGDPTASDDVGYEIDVAWTQSFNRHLKGLFGYSHFFAGDFIEDTGPSDDIDFAYVQFQFTF